ncbi:MAG: GIY-YIG nuclease family protein [Psychroserpens sp.]|uniref:nucleotide excision repair endonuclease n=1 Tax=Psychroserpens sp. TaxID=2020870 RepID=UPI003C988A2E
MKFIYLQSIEIKKKGLIPFRIFVAEKDEVETTRHLTFYPQIVISKSVYASRNIDRTAIITSPPFCDIADELIDEFTNSKLIFSNRKQFQILKSQFKAIGYNFNIKPLIIWHSEKKELDEITSIPSQKYSEQFGFDYVLKMFKAFSNKNIKQVQPPSEDLSNGISWKNYKPSAGVYLFYNSEEKVIYVGKAKNIRKRLQSHFSENGKRSNIDYSAVNDIEIIYTGNDCIAQLVESEKIKNLKPIYNTQQVNTSSPFIINKGLNAKGIIKLKIVRKDFLDNMSEKYFNRESVKQSLKQFCETHHLCRKFCGIEFAKGPCTRVTVENSTCICNGSETVEEYNERFNIAFREFQNKKTRSLYKLKGRNLNEDAFVYTINGIYQGYGFIDKFEEIRTESDILGFLIQQNNNYDTSRIVNSLKKLIKRENIIQLDNL